MLVRGGHKVGEAGGDERHPRFRFILFRRMSCQVYKNGNQSKNFNNQAPFQSKLRFSALRFYNQKIIPITF